MKKGFTLIELLSVIIILAIILVIAVPRILKIIDNVKIEALKKSEISMVNAAKLYMTNNIDSLPIEEGNSTEITLAELQQQGLIKTINSPQDKTKECKGYIIITKVRDNEYDYIPHLNCISNINTSIEDALVGHYTFDDFQEPTVNLAAGAITAYTDYNTLIRNGQDLTLTMVSGGAQHLTIHNGIDYNGKIISLSGYIFKNGNPHVLSGDRANTYHSVPATKWYFNLTNGRFEIVENCNTSSIWLFHLYAGTSGTDVITLKDFQVEQKPYITPFTPNTRSGVVKDHSENNNHATLQLSSTPRWVEDSKVGKGAYSFNGTSNVISTNSFSFGSNLSICLWAKPSASSVKEMVMHGDYSNGAFEFYQNNTSISLRGGGTSTVTGNNALSINNWNFVCGTVGGTVGKVYSNGVLLNTGTVQVPRTDSRPLNIGAYNDLQYSYNGLMDDIRVYNRVLSLEEIKNIYDIEK